MDWNSKFQNPSTRIKMRFTILTLAATLCLALVSSHPLPEDSGLRSEALDRLVMAEADSEAALRSKRTIGILRQLFPEISQRIEEKVNSIIGEIIRVLGPVILRNVLGGGGGGGGAGGDNAPGVERSNDGTSVEGKSPFDDDEEEDTESSSSSNSSRLLISLPTFPPDEEVESSSSSSTSSSVEESRDNIDSTSITTTTTITPSLLENEVTTTQ
ncbi:uncharacterized protein LOC105829602 isoform X3 [Monomorium pharaonis]|uniref:uncharacterized protein LOC105829602 isoform X3 n=1 Tax=Monomorium pharaonis TaxID=307658 RepID=UPI00063F5712|nr:uncharacterized protein LOC105829602 isoform X3 [Monomorium pharaonis]XP_012524060.1 uncharacterized protein LOC105829602 isoform X3 [Monomorium pharaonis]